MIAFAFVVLHHVCSIVRTTTLSSGRAFLTSQSSAEAIHHSNGDCIGSRHTEMNSDLHHNKISLQYQYHTIAVRFTASDNFLRIVDCRRNAHRNWPKIIYSLTYSTSRVYKQKMQLKLNCLIGLAVMVPFAHVATANCKLQRIQCEPCC